MIKTVALFVLIAISGVIIGNTIGAIQAEAEKKAFNKVLVYVEDNKEVFNSMGFFERAECLSYMLKYPKKFIAITETINARRNND